MNLTSLTGGSGVLLMKVVRAEQGALLQRSSA